LRRQGKKRKSRLTVQGKFKRPMRFNDVVTGQVLSRPAKNLPAKWLVEQVLVKVRFCELRGAYGLGFCITVP
jgi:Protein of unknown function (DUF1769)